MVSLSRVIGYLNDIARPLGLVVTIDRGDGDSELPNITLEIINIAALIFQIEGDIFIKISIFLGDSVVDEQAFKLRKIYPLFSDCSIFSETILETSYIAIRLRIKSMTTSSSR